jgi:hypothetical protein
MLPPPIALVILDSHNLRANPTTRQQGTMSILMACLITHAQVSTIIDLTMERPHKVESFNHPEQDKWASWEERLRVVEGFDVYDLVRVNEICLVLDVVVPKKLGY